MIDLKEDDSASVSDEEETEQNLCDDQSIDESLEIMSRSQ